jgi:hypothetical protein
LSSGLLPDKSQCVTWYLLVSGYSVKHPYPWLVEHMPVASFFTLINKFHETKEAERLVNPNGHHRYYMEHTIGMYVYSLEI